MKPGQIFIMHFLEDSIFSRSTSKQMAILHALFINQPVKFFTNPSCEFSKSNIYCLW